MFPAVEYPRLSLSSPAENLCFRLTLFGLSCCSCPHLRNFISQSDCQVSHCAQLILCEHVVGTTVSATDHFTTGHVVRPTYHSRPRRTYHHDSPSRDGLSHDHTRSATMLKWIGVMTPFSWIEMTERCLIQRTPHAHVQSECVHTSAVKSSVIHVYTAPTVSQ